MKTILTAAALALTTTTANADTVTLTRANAGTTLHETDADMSVYWVEDGDAYALTATYVTGEAPADPARLRMHLADGDAVTFGLPGVQDRVFTFGREGDTVSVRSARVSVDYASK